MSNENKNNHPPPNDWIDSAREEFKIIIEKLNTIKDPTEQVRTLHQAISFTYEFFNCEIDTFDNKLSCEHNECKLKNLMKIVIASRDIIDHGLIPLLNKYILEIERSGVSKEEDNFKTTCNHSKMN